MRNKCLVSKIKIETAPELNLIISVNMEDEGGVYLHKHDDTFAQNLADRSFVVVVALKYFFLQELPRGQMERFIWSVEPAAIQPLLT